ncbi:MAG: sulfite exporter TauE/SafE family protein [Chitinophagaceae bacterium]|uniref:sulfite exporter TauE/SafE family protein n=1 Tax=unclassified Paraflavitalea TaxID=2798305 RepID=UPI003D34F55F|nr:sulfite exporter TauE/SafE family protein [Chitinophagaceae bacterium]
MDNYALFIILAMIAEIIGTVSGFGSSILFVPIASLFFDFKTVLGITAVFHVFSNLSKIFLFKKGIDKNIALKLGIPAVIFVIIGAYLTTIIPTKEIEIIMNITLIALSVYLLINTQKQIKRSNANLYWSGVGSGLLAGLIGTGGAIRGLTLAAFGLPKDIFIATSALIDLGVDASRAVVYVSNGYFSKQYIVLIPALIGVSLVGSYLGKLILQQTSEKLFRYIVLALIIITTIVQVSTYFYKN